MSCCIAELRNKEVICKSNGARLGNVDDVEIDIANGKITVEDEEKEISFDRKQKELFEKKKQFEWTLITEQ